MELAGLSLATLAVEGVRAAEAMQRFAEWVERVVPDGALPVLTALNAPFDWMFINDYFHRYLGRNPGVYLGHNNKIVHLPGRFDPVVHVGRILPWITDLHPGPFDLAVFEVSHYFCVV